MTEPIDPIRLRDNPPELRLWLLLEALRSAPLDRAVELARIAEAFITGSTVNARSQKPAPPPTAPSEVSGEPKESTEQISTSDTLPEGRPTEHEGLPLFDNDRDRLLDGLAKGARNAELAAEFGISRKQVQGLRMGCAREIARRRARLAEKPSDQSQDDEHDPTASASIDEVVRYLRQQDDVVVLQEDGGYMVNGRFRFSAAELVARANRMRSRQRKPSFPLHSASMQVELGSGPTGQPVFWEASPATEHGTNGWKHQRTSVPEKRNPRNKAPA